jgi:hypothetical protein
MEGGERALDTDRLGGLGPADPMVLRGDVVVEAVPHRVVKDRENAELAHR